MIVAAGKRKVAAAIRLGGGASGRDEENTNASIAMHEPAPNTDARTETATRSFNRISVNPLSRSF